MAVYRWEIMNSIKYRAGLASMLRVGGRDSLGPEAEIEVSYEERKGPMEP